MLKYDEIKKIVTEEYGFHDVATYREFLKDWNKVMEWMRVPGRVERLSPDNVDSVDFWQMTDDVFGSDTVCNTCIENVDKNNPHSKDAKYGVNNLDRERSNYFNFMIAKNLGMLVFIEEFARFKDFRIVEIGAGFGCIKDYVNKTSVCQYTGYDVVPRVPDIRHLQSDGTFSVEEIEKNRGTNMVFSTNVFQHLSERQRLSHIRAAYEMLKPGGLLIFNGMFDYGHPHPGRLEDGNCYAIHYGQLTPVMKLKEFYSLFNSTGWKILYTTQRHDQVCSLVCQKL